MRKVIHAPYGPCALRETAHPLVPAWPKCRCWRFGLGTRESCGVFPGAYRDVIELSISCGFGAPRDGEQHTTKRKSNKNVCWKRKSSYRLRQECMRVKERFTETVCRFPSQSRKYMTVRTQSPTPLSACLISASLLCRLLYEVAPVPSPVMDEQPITSMRGRRPSFQDCA
jgi:hypothetical protein